ncbi:hypothetical protein D3C78_1932960 [compost metagenome]
MGVDGALVVVVELLVEVLHAGALDDQLGHAAGQGRDDLVAGLGVDGLLERLRHAGLVEELPHLPQRAGIL